MSFTKFKKWVTDIVVKKSYNFDRVDINIYNFHPQMLVALAMQGIFSGKKDSLLRWIWPGFSVSLTFVAVGMETMFVIHGVMVEDFSFAIECFCYVVLLGCTPMTYFGILSNREPILDMVIEMNKDFLHVCSLGPRYREPFMDSQLLIWKLYLGWMLLTTITGGAFMFFPVALLFYQSLFGTQDEHTIRPLSYPMWLPYDDPYRTPNYEVFLFLQMSFSIIFSQGFCGYVYLLFHFLLHYNTMMDMIILDLEAIFVGLDETVMLLPKCHPARAEVQHQLRKRVGRIVTWHLSVFKALTTVSSVFGPPLVYQVMCTSTVLCLVFYQIAKKLEDGVIDVLFILLTAVATVQLWIPCYLGTVLRNKGFAIGDSCFYCGWNETPLGQLIKTDIAIIIFRSQIPIYIKFTGLPEIQLETFSSVMSSSYSYFNMLRQYSS